MVVNIDQITEKIVAMYTKNNNTVSMCIRGRDYVVKNWRKKQKNWRIIMKMPSLFKNLYSRDQLFFLLLFVLLSTPALAATYYISPTGSDSNTGALGQPFATFAHSFTKMSGGDTLYIMDGRYTQDIKNVPSGSPGNYTKIYAVNDYEVEIDGNGSLPSSNWTALVYLIGKSYIKIKGIVAHDSRADSHVLMISGGSQYIEVNNSIFYEGGSTKYSFPIYIGSSNILLEDVVAFGHGRYTIRLEGNNSGTILRRCIARSDSGYYASEPINTYGLYKANGAVLENCIAIDGNPTTHVTDHANFFIHTHTSSPAKNNTLYGCMAINSASDAPGFLLDADQGDGIGGDDNNRAINCLAIDTSRGIQIQSGTAEQLINCSSISNAAMGIRLNAGGQDAIIRNCLSYSNSSNAYLRNGGTYDEFSYNGYYGNSTNTLGGFSCSTGCTSANPGLLYPVRIESGSSYKGSGAGGADIGANIVKRYKNGSLTSTDLWPWPNEDKIKEIMCGSTELSEVGRTGSLTPGWASSGKSLTEYIWEYLGNPIPPEIYGGSGTTDPPGTPANLRIK